MIYFEQDCSKLLTNALSHLDMTMLVVEIVLTGGIFNAQIQLFRDTLAERVQRQVPVVRFIEASFESVVGAALLALEETGIRVDTAIRSNLDESTKNWN